MRIGRVKINILLVSPYFYPEVGGAENYVYNISKRLVEMGHKVTVLCSHERGQDEIIDGIQVIRLKISFKISRTPISVGLLNSMQKLIKKNNFDIININLSVPFFPEIAVLIGKINKIPCVLTYHNDIIRDDSVMKLITTVYNSTLNKVLLNSVDLIITPSPFCYNESEFLKPFKDKLIWIPPGVDIEKYSNSSLNIRNNHNIPENSDIILFVGVISKSHSHKGVDYLINAFKEVLEETQDVYLVLVGEGNLVPEYKKMAQNLGISNNVIFAGFVSEDELIGYYNSSNMVVLPSTTVQEGFGMVLIEGNACRKPVIGSEIGGIQYVIENGKTGLLVPPKNSHALAKSIIEILNNKNLSKKMGNAGRKLVEDKYTWNKAAKMTEEAFKELI
ncbi:MAG: glycosyltransferase family 4 protein [Methanobacterium sp.]